MKPFKFLLITLVSFMTLSSFAQESTSTSVKKFVDVVINAQETTSDAVSTIYDDTKGILTTTYSDGKDIINYITPKVEKAVTELANGLAVGAEELFSILVMQQVVYSVVYTFVLLALIILCIAFYKEVNKIQPNRVQEDIAVKSSHIEKHLILSAGYMIGIVTTAVIFFKNIIPFVMGYLNPKYGAIMEILNYAEKFIK